jgi:hypothetical protein
MVSICLFAIADTDFLSLNILIFCLILDSQPSVTTNERANKISLLERTRIIIFHEETPAGLLSGQLEVLDTLYLNGCDFIRSPSGLHLWTATGVYQDTLTASNTCDSVLTAFVELGQTKLTNIQDTSCSEITSPSGKFVWSSTGVYYDTLATSTSCDSVLKYELFIPNVKVTIKDSSGFLVASTSFMTYQWFECKEQFKKINGENKHLYKYQRSGEFTVEAIEHSCADTSGCLEVTISNIFTPEKTSSLKLFPNPTRGKLTIDAENFEYVEVYDTSGRLIIKSKLKTIDLEEQSEGLYLLKINANGATQEFKVFKE